MNPLIRPYQDSDFETITNLVSCLHQYFKSIDTSGQVRAPSTKEKAAAYTRQALADVHNLHGTILVAETANHLVGFIQGVVIDHHDETMHQLTHKETKEGWIGLLFIKPESRGQGLGKALITALKTHFIDQGCHLVKLKVATDNQSAIDIYSSLGFTTTNLEMSLQI